MMNTKLTKDQIYQAIAAIVTAWDCNRDKDFPGGVVAIESMNQLRPLIFGTNEQQVMVYKQIFEGDYLDRIPKLPREQFATRAIPKRRSFIEGIYFYFGWKHEY